MATVATTTVTTGVMVSLSVDECRVLAQLLEGEGDVRRTLLATQWLYDLVIDLRNAHS